MRVVDTNIVAYLLLSGDRTEQAQARWKADRGWRSDTFLCVEFGNLLATQVRAKTLTLAEAVSLLDRAGSPVQGMSKVSHADALRIAAAFGVSAYEARFLAAVKTLGTKLVPDDVRPRKAVPAMIQSLAQALAD